MASDETKKVDDKESPKSSGSSTIPQVNELNSGDSNLSPTKADLMEDIAKLKTHVNELQTELRDGLLMVSKKAR